MEKRYKLIEVKEGASGYAVDDIAAIGDVQPVYSVDNKFKTYLFETALEQGKTNIKNKAEFDRNVEIYKILQEAKYIGYDSVTIDVSGTTETFTKDEIEMISGAYEKSIVDIKTILKDLRKRIEEMRPKEPRVVVYTCITGGYDNLIEPTVVTQGIDYICFTDNMSMKSKVWKLRPMPEELGDLSAVKKQRGVKILAHRYLPEYDISIWVDGAVVVRGNINDFLKLLDLNRYSVFIPEHPVRKCLYKEKDACIVAKKIKGDGITLAEKQMKRYKEEGFPADFGLVQTNVMIRRHNTEYSKKLMEKWWEELKEYSHRDQLSFNYALWKIGSDDFKYLIKTTCNSKTFNWIKAHKKK